MITQALPASAYERRTSMIPADKVWIAVFVSSFLGLFVDGFDLQMLSITLPSLKAEWQLRNTKAGLLATWSIAGMAVGGLAGGWLAARFGRVRMAAWMIVLFSVGSLLLGFNRSYEQFIVVRIFTGLGLGAEYTICTMLMAEYVPTRVRTTVLGTLQASYSLGYLAAALTAGAILPVHGWRWLYYIAVVPVVLAIFVRHFIPEPPSWRRRAQAPRAAKRNEWAAIWHDRRVRAIFLLWAASSTLMQFGYFGANTWLPSYVASEVGVNFRTMTHYIVGTYTAAIAGKIVTGWLADRFGRRAMFAFGGLAILLPNCPAAFGPQVAERIRERVARSPVTTPEGRRIAFTVSLGGAFAPQWVRSTPGVCLARAGAHFQLRDMRDVIIFAGFQEFGFIERIFRRTGLDPVIDVMVALAVQFH